VLKESGLARKGGFPVHTANKADFSKLQSLYPVLHLRM